MNLFFLPVILVVSGLLAIRQSRSMTPERVSVPAARGGVSAADLVRQQAESVGAAGTVALCVFGGAAAAVLHSTSAWAWGLAAAVHVAVAITQRRTARALGLGPPVRTPQEAQRRRRTLRLVSVAVVLMGVGQVVAVAADRSRDDLLVGAGSAVVLASVVLLLAAGWSSVWVGVTAPRPPDPPPSLPTGGADTTPVARSGSLRPQSELPAPFTTRRSRARAYTDDPDRR